MSTLKDKLANSVRQAKSATVVAEPPPQPADRARAAPAKPAPVRTAPRAAEVVGAGFAADAQTPVSSAAEKFPRRVWPD